MIHLQTKHQYIQQVSLTITSQLTNFESYHVADVRLHLFQERECTQ